MSKTQKSYFDNVASLWPVFSLKKRLWCRCFLEWILKEFLRTTPGGCFLKFFFSDLLWLLGELFQDNGAQRFSKCIYITVNQSMKSKKHRQVPWNVSANVCFHAATTGLFVLQSIDSQMHNSWYSSRLRLVIKPVKKFGFY